METRQEIQQRIRNEFADEEGQCHWCNLGMRCWKCRIAKMLWERGNRG